MDTFGLCVFGASQPLEDDYQGNASDGGANAHQDLIQRSLTETFKDVRSQVFIAKASLCGQELEWLGRIIVERDAQEMLRFVERGQLADVSRQKVGCAKCNKRLNYESEKSNSSGFPESQRRNSRTRASIGVDGVPKSLLAQQLATLLSPTEVDDSCLGRHCNVCKRWFCDACCRFTHDLASFIGSTDSSSSTSPPARAASPSRASSPRGSWPFARNSRTTELKVECCASCHSFISNRQWRLRQPPSCLRPSSQYLFLEHRSLSTKITQLMSDMAQVEGFSRHLEQLLDIGDAVSRDCKDALEITRTTAIEALAKASRSQADIEATIKRIEQINCKEPPLRDEVVRDALIRHAKAILKEKKMQIGTATRAMEAAGAEVLEKGAVPPSPQASPRIFEATPVASRHESSDGYRFEMRGLDQ